MSGITKQSTQQLKVQHVPLRRCVLCRSSKSQSELIRFYKTDATKNTQPNIQTATWELDKHHLNKLKLLSKQSEKVTKPSGRGAWVCLDGSCHSQKKLAYFFKKQAGEVATQLSKVVLKHESTGTEASKTDLQTDLSQETKFHSGGMNV